MMSLYQKHHHNVISCAVMVTAVLAIALPPGVIFPPTANVALLRNATTNIKFSTTQRFNIKVIQGLDSGGETGKRPGFMLI